MFSQQFDYSKMVLSKPSGIILKTCNIECDETLPTMNDAVIVRDTGIMDISSGEGIEYRTIDGVYKHDVGKCGSHITIYYTRGKEHKCAKIYAKNSGNGPYILQTIYHTIMEQWDMFYNARLLSGHLEPDRCKIECGNKNHLGDLDYVIINEKGISGPPNSGIPWIKYDTIKEWGKRNRGDCGPHITIYYTEDGNEKCAKIYANNDDKLQTIYHKIAGFMHTFRQGGRGQKINIKYDQHGMQFGGKKISYKNIQKIETSKNNIKIFLKNKAFQIGGNQSDLKKFAEFFIKK